MKSALDSSQTVATYATEAISICSLVLDYCSATRYFFFVVVVVVQMIMLLFLLYIYFRFWAPWMYRFLPITKVCHRILPC